MSAKSADGLIEGMEDEEADFLISVQWHPEALGQKEFLAMQEQFALHGTAGIALGIFFSPGAITKL